MKKEQTQTKRNHQSKEEEATPQETKRKNNKLKQNVVTEEKKKKPHEVALWGVLRGKYKRQEEGKGTKRNTNTKRTESHTFRSVGITFRTSLAYSRKGRMGSRAG